MTALPNANAPLFDRDGRALPTLRGVLPGLPSAEVRLLDNGRATSVFRRYLSGRGVLVPPASVAFGDEQGRATRVFTRLLMEAAR